MLCSSVLLIISSSCLKNFISSFWVLLKKNAFQLPYDPDQCDLDDPQRDRIRPDREKPFQGRKRKEWWKRDGNTQRELGDKHLYDGCRCGGPGGNSLKYVGESKSHNRTIRERYFKTNPCSAKNSGSSQSKLRQWWINKSLNVHSFSKLQDFFTHFWSGGDIRRLDF